VFFRVCHFETDLSFAHSLVKEFIKSVGWNLLEGKDVINTSLPVGLFEPRSYLERLTDPFSWAQIFLKKAAGMFRAPFST
jgi:hypothetical protein